MLKTFRKKGVRKKILWVLVGGITVAFVLSPSLTLLFNNWLVSDYAGKIFDKKISLEEFDRNFRQTQIQAIMQYQENFSKIKQFLNLDGETWDRIILLQEAQKKGIKIPDDEVVKAIQNLGFLQRDGQFSKDIYAVVLQQIFKIKERDFEEGMRDTLRIAKLFEQQTAGAALSDQEILDAYRLRNQKVQISYLLFDADTYKEQMVFDETPAKKYFEDNRREFTQPAMIDVEYVQFKYPVKNPETSTPPQDPPTLTPEEKQVADTDAQNFIDSLNPSDDKKGFYLAAEDRNLQVETTGSFSIEQPNLKMGWSFDLIQKLFNMKTGEVTGPVETETGYHVLRIKERKESFVPEYPEAQALVKEVWIRREAKTTAQTKARESLKILQDAVRDLKRPDFVQIAKGKGFEIHQTPIFSRGQYLPSIGISRDFQEAAFSLDNDNAISSDVVEVEKGFCILHLDSLVPLDMAEFEKAKDQFTSGLLMEKKNKSFSDFLTQLRLQANLKDKVSELRDKGRITTVPTFEKSFL